MKNIIALAIVLLTSFAARADLKVVATLPDLAAIASEIGGPHVEVVTLAKPNQDPHYVDPRPNLMLPLNRADLLVINGLDIEQGWLPKLVQGARNAKILPGAEGYFDASTAVQRLQVPTTKIDRAMGDIHPGGNPHFTHDPRQAARIARALAGRMAQLDAKNAEHYRKGAASFADRAEALAKKEAARFAALPAQQRRIVAYHASLTYLNDWLELEQIITIEPKPGIQPTPGHVATVLQRMKSTGVKVIVQEEHYPQNVSQTLRDLAGAELVIIPTSTRFSEGQSYLQRVQQMTKEIYDAL